MSTIEIDLRPCCYDCPDSSIAVSETEILAAKETGRTFEKRAVVYCNHAAVCYQMREAGEET